MHETAPPLPSPAPSAVAPTQPPPLALRFACTLDDFLEAHKIHRRPARGDRLGLFERLLFLWILLATLAALVIIAIVEGTIGAVRGTGPMIEFPVANWAVAIAVPWMPWLFVTGVLWYAMSGITGGHERRPARQMLLVISVVQLLSNALALILSGGPAAQHARSTAAATATQATGTEPPFIVTLLPWLTVFFVVWIYIFRYVRGMLPRHWDAQPHLRLPQTLEQTPRGLRFADERAVLDYSWQGFKKYREGEGHFLIYVSEVSFHMVPKRAMSEPGQIEAFRQMLEQHVPSDDPIPARFPMHQPQPVQAMMYPSAAPNTPQVPRT